MNEFQKKRKELGLTQVELAERMEVSVRTLQNWEQGHRKPSSFVLKELVRVKK